MTAFAFTLYFMTLLRIFDKQKFKFKQVVASCTVLYIPHCWTEKASGFWFPKLSLSGSTVALTAGRTRRGSRRPMVSSQDPGHNTATAARHSLYISLRELGELRADNEMQKMH